MLSAIVQRVWKMLGRGSETVEGSARPGKKRRRRVCNPRKMEEIRYAVVMIRPLALDCVDSLIVMVVCCLSVCTNLVIKVRKRNAL